MKKNIWVQIVTILMITLCLAFTAVLCKAYLDGKFDSVETCQEYIAGYGYLAPAVLIFIQAMQVVVPVIPGILGCAAGAVLFGSAGGFWCNYIGISLGSIAAFLLARRFGAGLVMSMFPKGKYKKWFIRASNSKSYIALLFIGMALPLFPDDFFCYFSGLTKMTTRKFVWIIIIGKPWCILAYSLGFSLLK